MRIPIGGTGEGVEDTNNSRSKGTGESGGNNRLVSFRGDFKENVEQGTVIQEIRP